MSDARSSPGTLSRRGVLQLLGGAAVGLLAACQPAAPAPAAAPAPTQPPPAPTQPAVAPTQAAPVATAPAATAAPTTQTAVKPATSSMLRVALPGDIISLDTVQTNDNQTLVAIAAMSDHLVKPVPLGPELAKTFTRVQPDLWRFELQPNVKFHNGEDLTAEALTFTLNRYLDPAENSPNVTFLAGNIKSMNVVDPMTLEITTKTPVFSFAADMTDLLPQPPKYFQQVGKDGFIQKPVGTGPYVYASWSKGDMFQATRNENWWKGKPAFDRLVIRPILDENTRVAALLANEIDMASTIPFNRIADVQNSPQHQILKLDNERAIYCGMDTLNPPFDDARVRQAMNHAVNWDAIVNGIFGGGVVRTTGGFSPVMLGDDPTIQPYPYDLDKAKALMKDAGRESGFDSYIVVAPGLEGAANLDDVSQAMVADWAKIGVRVRIDTTDSAGFNDRYRGTGKPGGGGIKGGMYYFTHSGIQPGGRHLSPLFKSDTRGYYYQNPSVDKLITAYLASETDDQLKQNGHALKQTLKDDAPWVFMYNQPLLFGASKSINWKPNSGFYIPFGELTTA